MASRAHGAGESGADAARRARIHLSPRSPAGTAEPRGGTDPAGGAESGADVAGTVEDPDADGDDVPGEPGGHPGSDAGAPPAGDAGSDGRDGPEPPHGRSPVPVTDPVEGAGPPTGGEPDAAVDVPPAGASMPATRAGHAGASAGAGPSTTPAAGGSVGAGPSTTPAAGTNGVVSPATGRGDGTSGPAHPRRVVVVDVDVMTAIRLAIASAELEFVDSSRATTGFELVLEQRPGAVVVSRALPDGDGLDLVHRLRAHRDTADVTIVVLGPDGAELAADLALSAGADACLAKSTEPAEIVEVVARLLALTDEERAARRIGGAPPDAADLAPPEPRRPRSWWRRLAV